MIKKENHKLNFLLFFMWDIISLTTHQRKERLSQITSFKKNLGVLINYDSHHQGKLKQTKKENEKKQMIEPIGLCVCVCVCIYIYIYIYIYIFLHQMLFVPYYYYYNVYLFTFLFVPKLSLLMLHVKWEKCDEGKIQTKHKTVTIHFLVCI